ncbi:HAMP domain-containing histidine kinase [Enterococcus sp. ALS3]|uniref:histidine kinase n=1 Tax=Enterococcus alishanensis TaxID=1303817 RepID=A0ABS6TDG4_9ENTE|nr:HAMP domain-containing sensor histidine kinase [Enterococcus alishanensis]MBV7390943.1 HAMP domain-containing histidine kinase [Enterococcus alishanensis]
MKYLYQLMLAFFILTLAIISIIGLTFSQFTRRTLEQNNYSQLSHYAETIADPPASFQSNPYFNSGSVSEQLINRISYTEDVLKSQNVEFAFINADNEAEYPEINQTLLNKLVTKKEFKMVKNRSEIRKTLNYDLNNQNVSTAYVLRGLYQVDTGEFLGILVISQNAKMIHDNANAMFADLGKGFIVSAVIALIISYFLAQRQAKKVKIFNDATKKIAAGDFDVQLAANNSQDEFSQLGHSFNDMAVSLKESSEEIDRQEELRKQFMADASHEMKTPLTTIKGLLEGMRYDAIPAAQKKNAINLMEKETDRMIRLIKENLDYESIRANQIKINLQEFNATDALKDIVTQMENKAADEGDQLILEAPEKVHITADYDRFTQIVVNIVQNAIQFTHDGKIMIQASQDDQGTVIKISDTGIGMDPEQIKNIWERYYKVDPSRTNKKYAESGLGLSIVQQLMKLHNGTVTVVSELNQGTTFELHFPNR